MFLDGVSCRSLADSGSQVSSVSHSFFIANFSAKELVDCSQLLGIQGVGGAQVPYHGYFYVEVGMPLVDSSVFKRSIPVLVVNDTDYNLKVPFLCGSNFLQRLLEDSSFSIHDLLPAFKMSVLAMQLSQRHLEKTNGVYGRVLASEDINVPAYSGALLIGKATVAIPVKKQLALVQQCGVVPVLSGLVEVYHGPGDFPIEIVNNSGSALFIRKGEEIAQLHQASIHIPEPEVKMRKTLFRVLIFHISP